MNLRERVFNNKINNHENNNSNNSIYNYFNWNFRPTKDEKLEHRRKKKELKEKITEEDKKRV